MRRIGWLFVVPALAALGWHGYVALATADVSPYRLAAIATSLAVIAFGARLRAAGSVPGALAATAALLGSGIVWISVLEISVSTVRSGALVERGRVLALGLLVLLAAALVHATVLAALVRPAARSSRSLRLATRVGLSLSMAALLCCAIEGAFRLLHPLRFYEIVPDDPAAGSIAVAQDGMLVLRPGFRGRYVHPEFDGSRIEINALGMRDTLDETAPPPPGAQSVLVVGDSFTFGTGVALEETFHQRIEKNAASITARPLCVYGAGVPGYGPAGYRRRIAQLASRTRPDAVVVGVFEGNDFQDNLGAADVAPELRAEAQAAQQARRGTPLLRFVGAIGELPFWAGSSAAVQALGIDVTLVRLGIVGAGLYNYVFLDIGLQVPLPELAARIREATLDELDRIHSDCEALGAALVVLVIPDAIQADPARFALFCARERADTRFDRTAFHDGFVALLRARGIEVVDVLAGLEAEITAGKPCYHREGHWNARGHMVAAERLAPALAAVLRPR